MTEFFEVLDRDGAARLGELRLDEPLQTPTTVDAVLEDAGSRWVNSRDEPEGSSATLTILPHRGMPTGTRGVVQEAFAPSIPDVTFPSAAVITPHLADDLGADAYVLSGLTGIDRDPRRLVEAITETRRAIPPDTALYAPGIAEPASVALLSYLGIDLFDTDRSVIAATQGRYLVSEGSIPVEDLDELPCPCEVCRPRSVADLDVDALTQHNIAQLDAMLRLVRERIGDGRLRDYLEGQVRHQPWLTSAMRQLDQEWSYLEERTPVARQSAMTFTTDDALHRVEVVRFADRLTSRYRPQLDEHPLVLVPCSATKPYSQSPSHRHFREAIDFRGHIVSLTSPFGVVPDELELVYPAQHYDTAVTGHWSASEQAFVTDVLEAYLRRASYPRIIAHVPAEGYRSVIQEAVDRVGGFDLTFTVVDHPTDDDSLSHLSSALEGEWAYRRNRRYRAIVAAIADMQFGPGIGADLVSGAEIVGRYPRLRLRDRTDEQLLTLVPQYGQLAFTLAGARWLAAHDSVDHVVAIEGFVPHGSVLAPGVIDADPAIRVGDEVLVEGPAAFGVGRAAMYGDEMVESSRGIAVDVRHVQER